MILAPCVVLLGIQRQALGLALVTLGWAGAVAFGRVSYGAHFPTDVLFSIGIGVALAPLSLTIAVSSACTSSALTHTQFIA